MATFSSAWIKVKMEFNIPSFAFLGTRQHRYSMASTLVKIPIMRSYVLTTMGIYPGAPGEVSPAYVPATMTIILSSFLSITSSIGEMFEGSFLESLSSGETKAELVVKESVNAGTRITITDEVGSVLFSGKSIRSTYDESTDLWSVTAVDPLSEAGLNVEFPLTKEEDVADAIPFEFDDLSQKTLFPTVPVESGITLKYWIELLEALRGAKLYYDPNGERYVLSDKPRVWQVPEVLTFTETIDPSQYSNMVIVEQDDSWEEGAVRETKTTVYGGFKLITDRAGEQIYMAGLTGADGTIAINSFVYDGIHQVVKTTSIKGTKTTTTDYTIQPGDNPYIRSIITVTLDTLSETAFSERKVKTVNTLTNSDGTILIMITESREWFEKEQVIEYE